MNRAQIAGLPADLPTGLGERLPRPGEDVKKPPLAKRIERSDGVLLVHPTEGMRFVPTLQGSPDCWARYKDWHSWLDQPRHRTWVFTTS